jgi:hypothetical protein
MKFSTFFDYVFWKISVGVWNIRKTSLVSQKIGQIFRNLIKKKSIIYFKWFRSFTFFNEALQSRFFEKKMILVKNDDR